MIPRLYTRIIYEGKTSTTAQAEEEIAGEESEGENTADLTVIGGVTVASSNSDHQQTIKDEI